MTISNDFSIFCKNLEMNDSTIEKIQKRYKAITKRINLDYRNLNSDTSYSWYVGSYGRDTEIWTSDIDIIIALPLSVYLKFNAYKGNGQSALLQEVKESLKKTYPTSHLKGDGQVVGINFEDKINFEIVPAFINDDNISFTYPDANGGGSWKTTNPRKEIEAINSRNALTNKNLKRLCRMIRAWKSEHDVNISGILIDTLAYKFINEWTYKDKSFLYYDYMSRDFFQYLKNIDTTQQYWHAPGSNRLVFKDGNFQSKAKKAYDLAVEAISLETSYPTSAKRKWREIYGSKFL